MNLSDARKLVASYLAGEAVPKEDLEDACETINQGDQKYARFLRDELGLREGDDSLCEVFSERVAEFSELTETERREEMPELDAHLVSCSNCRAMYRDMYLGAFATAASWTKHQIRRLTEPIRLTMGWKGELRQSGMGPMALEAVHTFAGAHLGPGDPEVKEWSIVLDQESGLVLQLSVAAQEFGGSVRAIVAFQGETAEDAKDMKLELYQVQGERKFLRMTDRIQAYATQPLVIESGVWAIRLVAAGGATWEIPLVLNSEA